MLTQELKTSSRDEVDGAPVKVTLRGPQNDLIVPSYDELPPVEGMPHGCTWGLWDREGQKDELGTLNLLTPATILAARNEIQHGISLAINWSLDNCETPHSGRRKPNHKIMQLPDWVGHDDEIQMNTQSGSQWDGFREISSCGLTCGVVKSHMLTTLYVGHWAHQPSRTYYNGVSHADITSLETPPRNGIDREISMTEFCCS